MVTYLTHSQIQQLEQAAPSLRDRLLIRLLYRLGGRVSEVLSLTLSDIDTENCQVRIRYIKHRTNRYCPKCRTLLSKRHLYCPGCGVKITKARKKVVTLNLKRILPVDGETMAIIEKHISTSGTAGNDGSKLLFPINRHRAWQIVTGCARAAGLPEVINPQTGKSHHISPHRLRDAFAINAVRQDDSDNDIKMLKSHLGHSRSKTTQKYLNITKQEQKQWYANLWEPDS